MTIQKQRPILVCRRWFDVIVLSVLAWLICIVCQPLLNFVGMQIGSYFRQMHWLIQFIVITITTALWWFILLRFGGFRIRDLWALTSLRYPPVWIFALLSALFYFLAVPYAWVTQWPKSISPDVSCYLLAIVSLALGLVVAKLFAILRNSEKIDKTGGEISPISTKGSKDLHSLIKNPEELATWIQKDNPIGNPTEDIFKHSQIARRIARILQESPLKTVGIVGPYGCGKSSIVNMVDFYLKNPEEFLQHLNHRPKKPLFPYRIVSCRVGGWGMRKGSASEHILGKVVKELYKYVDCLGLIGLPSHYNEALSNMNPSWGKPLVILMNPIRDPLAVLGELDRVLVCIGMRLIIYLEDLDRNVEENVFKEEIASLLDNLKRLDNFSFVLAIGKAWKGGTVLTRILEHVEIVPTLPTKQVTGLVKVFRNYCFNRFDNDVDCRSIEARETRLGLVYDALLEQYIERPINAVAKLLPTPRVAKNALRRTWQTWQNLHGELDLDDLLVANVLRAGAPESFSFLLEKTSHLRGQLQEESNQKKREKLHMEWENINAEDEWDREAAYNLIGFLFPTWTGGFSSETHPPQGVMLSEPVDYWQRLNAEEVSDRELRDQVVLRAVNIWKEEKEAAVYNGLNLSSAILQIEGFAERIKHFGFLLDGEEVRMLARELFALILRSKETRRKGENNPGFIELWLLALDKPVKRHDQWILDEIIKALPISFQVSNELYNYWRSSDRSMVENHPPKPQLRDSIVAEAKRIFNNRPDALIRTMDFSTIYGIFKFAIMFSQSNQGGSGFEPNDWQWLAVLLLEAGDMNPQVVVPQLAGLVVRHQRIGNRESAYEFDKMKALPLFQKELPRFIHLLEQEVDVSEFNEDERKIIEFARKEAKKLLSEQ